MAESDIEAKSIHTRKLEELLIGPIFDIFHVQRAQLSEKTETENSLLFHFKSSMAKVRTWNASTVNNFVSNLVDRFPVLGDDFDTAFAELQDVTCSILNASSNVNQYEAVYESRHTYLHEFISACADSFISFPEWFAVAESSSEFQTCKNNAKVRMGQSSVVGNTVMHFVKTSPREAEANHPEDADYADKEAPFSDDQSATSTASDVSSVPGSKNINIKSGLVTHEDTSKHEPEEAQATEETCPPSADSVQLPGTGETPALGESSTIAEEGATDKDEENKLGKVDEMSMGENEDMEKYKLDIDGSLSGGHLGDSTTGSSVGSDDSGLGSDDSSLGSDDSSSGSDDSSAGSDDSSLGSDDSSLGSDDSSAGSVDSDEDSFDIFDSGGSSDGMDSDDNADSEEPTDNDDDNAMESEDSTDDDDSTQVDDSSEENESGRDTGEDDEDDDIDFSTGTSDDTSSFDSMEADDPESSDGSSDDTFFSAESNSDVSSVTWETVSDGSYFSLEDSASDL